MYLVVCVSDGCILIGRILQFKYAQWDTVYKQKDIRNAYVSFYSVTYLKLIDTAEYIMF